jgi:hypothetical protein
MKESTFEDLKELLERFESKEDLRKFRNTAVYDSIKHNYNLLFQKHKKSSRKMS